MTVSIINPNNGLVLTRVGDFLVDSNGESFEIIGGVARFSDAANYTYSFGVQWNKFDTTQFDRELDGLKLSYDRFFSETCWNSIDLSGKSILEVGSGAGRFSRVILQHTPGLLYSVDYSDAVTANYINNSNLAPERFKLFQASIYALPFPNLSFDKVLCIGVLQHTPDFEESIKMLINKAKIGGEIVVDFYPIKGWWTKLNAKYIFRPITKRLKHKRLFSLIEKNIGWLIWLSLFLRKNGLGIFTRFLPLVDISTLPMDNLNTEQFREWVKLDTFDMFSPVHDHPQKIDDVVAMFNRNGAEVTFAGFVDYGVSSQAAVVRGIKKF